MNYIKIKRMELTNTEKWIRLIVNLFVIFILMKIFRLIG